MESNTNTPSKKSELKRAQIMSVESLLSVKLTIPDYQRPYKWNIKNITDLLVDIENAITEGEKYNSFRYKEHGNRMLDILKDACNRLRSV